MSITPIVGSGDPDDNLQDALIGFTGCLGEAFDDICSYGLTIGETYVPFDPDPEDNCDPDEAACSQMWVRVTNIHASANSSWEGTCALELVISLEVGILRCIDIPEGGEAPTTTDVMAAALQSMADMRKILCTAMGCEVWASLDVGIWNPSGPLGGQYGGTWTFTATL